MLSPITWIDISQSALNHNIAYFKKKVGSAPLIAVVKSDAYGHGMLTIARLCEDNEAITSFMVVTLSEALILRREGITKPILVMGYIDDDPAYAVKHSIDISVGDYTLLKDLSRAAIAHGKNAFVHLKIDTGLSRFGFLPAQALEAMNTIRSYPNITVRGLCTHFLYSTISDSDYTECQRTRFSYVIRTLASHGSSPALLHADKTYTSNTRIDGSPIGARIGAGLYGLLPDMSLRPVMHWKSYIAHIRDIDDGIPIGYGRTYYTQGKKRIAAIPIGYFDGYDRRLSNGGQVIVQYKSHEGNVGAAAAPVVGMVAMNVIMIDISLLPQAQVGDNVILLGDYPGVRPWEISALTGGGNPREVTVGLHAKIERRVTP